MGRPLQLSLKTDINIRKRHTSRLLTTQEFAVRESLVSLTLEMRLEFIQDLFHVKLNAGCDPECVQGSFGGSERQTSVAG